MLDIKAVEEKLETVQEILDGLKEEIDFIKQKKSEQKEDLTKLCTIDEKIILKNLPKFDKDDDECDWWLARDRFGFYLYNGKPIFNTVYNWYSEASEDFCHCSRAEMFNIFSHLFKFIGDNTCYRVSDLIADLEEEIDL